MLRIWFILASCLAAVSPVFGVEPAGVSEQWLLPIVRLGDADPAVRKRAAEELLAGGESAVGALAIAAKDNSSEVGAASRGILRDLAIGITAKTPAKLVEMVRLYRHGRLTRDEQAIEDAVKGFCQNSPDGLVLLAGAIELDKAGDGFAHFMPRPVLSDAARVAPSVAARLLQDGRELDACRVLHMASLLEESPSRGDADFVTFLALASEDNKELAGAWAAVRGVVEQAALVPPADAKADRISWTGRQSLAPNGARRAACSADELRKFGSSREDLSSLAIRGEWPALAARLSPDEVGKKGMREVTVAVLAHRLAGTSGADKLIERLQGPYSGPNPARRVPAFLFAGKADAGIQAAFGSAARAEAMGLLGRYPEVMDALVQLDQSDPIFGDLLRVHLLRIEAPLHLGVPADKALSQLTSTLVARRDFFEMKAAVEMLQRIGRRNEAIEIAAATVDQTPQWEEQPLFQALYGQRSYDATKLFRWLELEKRPPLKESLLRLDRVMSGGLNPVELDALVTKLRTSTDDLAIVNTLVPTVCRVVRMHGQTSRARDLLLRASKGRFSLNGIKAGVGEELMRLGEYAEAARLFEMSARADPDPLLRYLWGICVERAGDVRGGRAICRIASLMPLGNASQRLEQAITLFDEGFSEEARRELTICLRMREFAPAQAAEALPYLATLHYQRGEYEKANDAMAQSMMLRYLQEDALEQPIGRDFHRWLRCRVRAAIARGDKAVALAELDEALCAFADDAIILFDALGPMLARPEFAGEARARAAKWIARREKLIEKYPNSPELLAGLALILIRQGSETTRAGALLDKAAQIDPGNRQVRLVRAEALWVRGDRAAAVEVIRPLARQEAPDRVLSQAAERLEKGKAEDPWPEF